LTCFYQWEKDFSVGDPSLHLVHEMCQRLRSKGIQKLVKLLDGDFCVGALIKAYDLDEDDGAPLQARVFEEEREREKEDLQLAMALSLTELESRRDGERGSNTHGNSYYPKASDRASIYSVDTLVSNATTAAPIKIVKALYDFQGREGDEMSFKSGEIIQVTEDSHVDWWKGFIQKEPTRIGLFPQSYTVAVTTPSLTYQATFPQTSPERKEDEDEEENDLSRAEEFCRIIERAKLASTAYRYRDDPHLKVNPHLFT
jgi:SH3 domain